MKNSPQTACNKMKNQKSRHSCETYPCKICVKNKTSKGEHTKRKGKNYFVWILLLLGSFLIFTPKGPVQGADKVITIGEYSTIRTLDPAFVVLSQNIMICRNIHQSLLHYKFNTS